MRLLICAGGTGGGVYPALAVLQSLEREYESAYRKDSESAAATRAGNPGADVLWVGVEGGMEEALIRRSAIPFDTIPAAGVHGVGWRRLPGNLLSLVKGYRRSTEILKGFKPDAMFFTGGYIAVPMALAGRRVPTLVFVPDIEPGLALKTLAKFADHIAVSAEATRQYLPRSAKVTVTGYPTRSELASWNKENACKSLELTEDFPVLLAFGGSKGARSINRALMSALPELLREMQVVHITGELDWDEIQGQQEALPGRLADRSLVARYHAFPYLHDQMGAALAAADLALSRAGASILGEYPLFGLPAILVPYPYAWQYQMTNAEFLAKQGAAVIIRDEDLPANLTAMVLQLIRHPELRLEMRQAMLGIAPPQAAKAIAGLLKNIAGVSSPGKEPSR